MKKLITSLFVLSLLVSFWFANSQLEDAVNWMHNNGLTKFDNPIDFMADKPLRRDEATKFFWQYATTIQKSTTDETKTECNNFTDLNEWWEDLKSNMQDACKLWLFRGSKWKFMPKVSLTNGQAITVLIRMIDWLKDESQWHFAQKYYETANELGILDGLNINPSNFDTLITRWNIAILLLNTSKLNNTISTTHTSSKASANQPTNINNLQVDYIYGSNSDWIELYYSTKGKKIYFDFYDPNLTWSGKILSFEKTYVPYIKELITSSKVSISCIYLDWDYCYGDMRIWDTVGSPETSLITKITTNASSNQSQIDSWKKVVRDEIKTSVKYSDSLVLDETKSHYNLSSWQLDVWWYLTVSDDSSQVVKWGYILSLKRNKTEKIFRIINRYTNIPDSALIDNLRTPETTIINTNTYVPIYYPIYTDINTYTTEDWETCRQRIQREYSFKWMGRSTAVIDAIESECWTQP